MDSVRHVVLACCLGLVTPASVCAEQADPFIEANVLSIFYHEMGHAIIDVMGVPIFGQEEDAADVMSVLLIHWFFDEDAAQTIAYESAFGYINDPDVSGDVAWWDVHGPDEQRYYNHVCLFYGGNADERSDFADDMGLPEARADSCEEEFEMAQSSWGSVFDEIESAEKGAPLAFIPAPFDDAAELNRILAYEVTQWNDSFKLPAEVTVQAARCDEANAFYDPNIRTVTFCTEFMPYLAELKELHGAD